ncbi:MAG: restriction endonuclease subunit S [Bdellovibrionota bacterium]
MSGNYSTVIVKEIASAIQYGYTESSTSEPIGPHFLRITDIQNNNVNWEKVPYCKIDDELLPKYTLKSGDLVFARTGATVGKSFLIRGDIPNAIFASYLIRLRFPDSISDRYVWYFFQSPFYWNQIKNKKVGTGQPNVNGTKLGKLTLPIAPLPEQRAIVAKIEKLFSDLDHAVANIKTAQEKLKIYRQAVLQKAFKSSEEYSFSLKQISEVGEIVTGNTPSKKNKEYYVNPDFNFYKPTDLNAGDSVFESIDKISSLGFEVSRKVPKDSVLVTCIGATIGKTGIVRKEGAFNQQINAIIPAKNMSAKFIYYQIITHDFQKSIIDNSSSTTLPILNKGRFSKLNILVCPIEKQNQIVQEIESRLSVCDNIEQNIQEGLGKAQSLRQSILKKAFEGTLLADTELQECRKQPDWEPAEKLLEKIKAEQEKAKPKKRKKKA